MVGIGQPLPLLAWRMKRTAFTIVELLVAVAIISLLVALLLPAVQAAREASRRSHCANNLRQVAVSLLLFHDQFGEFPTGGWGHQWIGVQDRGAGMRQPGGWIYSLLPYLEQANLHRKGARSSGEADESSLLEQPLPAFNCPTRRPLRTWQVSGKYPYMSELKPAGSAELVGRGDYAINGGASKAQSFKGPDSLVIGDSSTYSWPNPAGIPGQPTTVFSGISHIRMATRLERIEDGTSNTYLVGEKYADPVHYEDGESPGDNESLYNGFCSDNHRFTELDLMPAADGSLPLDVVRSQYRFGSAHANGLYLASCDGAVHFVSFDIDPQLYFFGGHVADNGLVILRP
jgi:hypothetical protein